MRIGRIGAISIRLHWTMLLLILACVCAGLAEKVLLVLAAVLLHELAHAFAAQLLGIRLREIQLFPFGGQAKTEDLTALHPLREAGMAAAGPAASFLLAGLFSWGAAPSWAVEFFVQTHLMLGGFNLLPVLPLDGGRMVRAFLGSVLGFRRATRITAGLGQGLGILLLICSLWHFPLHISWQHLLTGGVLFWTACREQRFFGCGFLRYLMHHRQQLFAVGVLMQKNLICPAETEIGQLLKDVDPRHYLVVTLVDEKHRILHQRTESQLVEAFMEKGPHTKVKEVSE